MTIEGAKNNGVDQLKWHGVNIDDLSKTDDSNSAAPKENSIFALVDGDGNGNIDEGEYKYLQSLIEDNMENKNGEDILTKSGAKRVLAQLQKNGNKVKSLMKNITAGDILAFAQKILSIQNDKTIDALASEYQNLSTREILDNMDAVVLALRSFTSRFEFRRSSGVISTNLTIPNPGNFLAYLDQSLRNYDAYCTVLSKRGVQPENILSSVERNKLQKIKTFVNNNKDTNTTELANSKPSPDSDKLREEFETFTDRELQNYLEDAANTLHKYGSQYDEAAADEVRNAYRHCNEMTWLLQDRGVTPRVTVNAEILNFIKFAYEIS